MDPVRLQRKQPARKQPPIRDVMNKDIIIRIKFYALFLGAMILFLMVCFALKPQTYGFL